MDETNKDKRIFLKELEMTGIYNLLLNLNLVQKETVTLYSNGTRDIADCPVYRDIKSEIIFIDNFYTGDKTYKLGDFRKKNADFEHEIDTRRRYKNLENFIIGKSILDFGCGLGSFLIKTKDKAKSSIGIELDEQCIKKLKHHGIPCYQELEEIEDKSIDTVFLFHVLEHLPNPIETLLTIKKKIKPGGKVVCEVPHARDFLLKTLNIDEFKAFTLWSQHLILHTRESLKVFFKTAGYNIDIIYGEQRYGLANHMAWAAYRKPGGHKDSLSWMKNPDLDSSYECMLNKIDQTDTIILVATV